MTGAPEFTKLPICQFTNSSEELGLTDLALTQVLFVVGLPWVGVAAKQGPSHVIFWLIAMALFYIPSAIVVIYLNRIMPLEGGLYQWAKLGFNEVTGFLVAWNLWLFAILNTSETGLQVTQYVAVHRRPAALSGGPATRGSSCSSARRPSAVWCGWRSAG